MYAAQSYAGNTPDFWEENWENSEFEAALKFCRIDPLRPLFEKYSRQGDLMLEGGCGMGQYLTFYKELGRKVVGLDFAQNTLKNLRKRSGDLWLCAGDVANLPFPDETFDLYYSGGVVEHFEGGATESLREARRVLKKTGVLLISVPYYSPLRKILLPLKKSEWREVEKAEIDKGEVFNGKKFFQYAYQTGEFEKMLNGAGLRVIEKQGYAVIWGLYDIPLFQNGGVAQNSEPARSASADSNPSLLKRLAVSEDASVPILGFGARIMRRLAANMMMYVCRK